MVHKIKALIQLPIFLIFVTIFNQKWWPSLIKLNSNKRPDKITPLLCYWTGRFSFLGWVPPTISVCRNSDGKSPKGRFWDPKKVTGEVVNVTASHKHLDRGSKILPKWLRLRPDHTWHFQINLMSQSSRSCPSNWLGIIWLLFPKHGSAVVLLLLNKSELHSSLNFHVCRWLKVISQS